MRSAFAILAIFALSGCTLSHDLRDSGGVAPPDGGSSPPLAPPSPGVSTETCGPNVCLPGEICCAPGCGVCTLPEACEPETLCFPGRIVCGGTLCEAAFCCPDCDRDVCPPEGVTHRGACPPLDC